MTSILLYTLNYMHQFLYSHKDDQLNSLVFRISSSGNTLDDLEDYVGGGSPRYNVETADGGQRSIVTPSVNGLSSDSVSLVELLNLNRRGAGKKKFEAIPCLPPYSGLQANTWVWGSYGKRYRRLNSTNSSASPWHCSDCLLWWA